MKSGLAGMVGGVLAIIGLAGFAHLYDKYRQSESTVEAGASWAEHDLRELIHKVESYNLIFGIYPDSLDTARGGWSGSDEGARGCKCRGDYYYSLLEGGQGYFLLSKGPDCEPFTDDDIHPDLSATEKERVGLQSPDINLALVEGESCTGT